MDGPGLRLAIVRGVALSVAAFVSAAASAEPSRPSAEMLEHAALNDVTFIDPDRGWAVGDRGAIWRTEDGGRRWTLQDSPVACRLHAVQFLDGENGWAVGGWTHPYTHKSTGVVLRTEDGGRNWRRLPTGAVPALRRIRMFDGMHGWAIGAASPLYPAGVYRTEDGGRGWATLSGDHLQGWIAGDFRDPVSGVVAGRGEAAVVGMNRLRASAANLDAQETVRQVRFAGDGGAWLVGDDGLVLHSRDGGADWTPPPGQISPEGWSAFDFSALAVWRNHVWIAGSPGTRVFHSADGGATWESFPTDQTLPLRSLFFLDEHRGWAVGALGAILASRDGGRTWLPQRGGGSRLAVLGIFADPQRTPWELFVRLSGNEGYLGGVEYALGPRDASGLEDAELPLLERAHEAMIAAGGSYGSGWEEGRRTKDEGQKTFAGDSHSLEEYVVRKLRQWRPDVVVTEPANPTEQDPQRRRINQAVLNAVMKADDPAAFPEHMQQLGLAPWSVKRLFGAQPPGESGSIAVVAASLAPQMGGTLADGAAAARSLLHREFQTPHEKLEFQRLVDRAGGSGGESADLMAGLSLAPGGEARRRASELSAGSLDLVTRNAQKQRNVQQILARSMEQSGDAAMGQVEELVRGLSDKAAGDLLFQLAEGLRQNGQANLAVAMYQRVFERHPQHDACEAAALRLVQLYASTEAASRSAGGTQIRDGKAVSWGQTVAKSHPGLFAAPELQFSLAAAARRQGETRDGERFFRHLASRSEPAGWRTSAQAELWLMKPTGDPPKQLASCKLAKERPYLDGRLDDELWLDAAHLELTSSEDGAPPALFYLARDAEYLYFAAHCRKTAAGAYPASDSPRTYDAPLEKQDRIELRIDLDRDYTTYYRFAADHRGWTSEACLGDAAWNPEWFVAASSDAETWTIEAAIPFRQLAPQPPSRHEVWAAGVQRKLPHGGVQAWTAPATEDPRPESFGLLLFE